MQIIEYMMAADLLIFAVWQRTYYLQYRKCTHKESACNFWITGFT